MDFTPEVEDEGISNAVSHILDRPLVNTSKKVWRDSTQTQNPNPTFLIGDSLRYTNKGHNEMVDLVDIPSTIDITAPWCARINCCYIETDVIHKLSIRPLQINIGVFRHRSLLTSIYTCVVYVLVRMYEVYNTHSYV